MREEQFFFVKGIFFSSKDTDRKLWGRIPAIFSQYRGVRVKKGMGVGVREILECPILPTEVYHPLHGFAFPQHGCPVKERKPKVSDRIGDGIV